MRRTALFGIILSSDSAGALILTSYHVVKDQPKLYCYFDGAGPVQLEIKAVSEEQDLCVLQTRYEAVSYTHLNPCFEHRAVKSAVLYSGVLYACACALLFSSGSMLYATGLQSETQTVGYYVVAAKVVLVVVALVIAAFEPKGVEMVTDCAEETAAEISDDEAGKMGL